LRRSWLFAAPYAQARSSSGMIRAFPEGGDRFRRGLRTFRGVPRRSGPR